MHTRAKMAGAHPGFISMMHAWEYCYPLERMLVHRRVTPSSMALVLIYTSGPSCSKVD